MSVVASPVFCRRPAMNTWFEIVLLGDDSENLNAAGEAALDEIERIAQLLSRFDPRSEVSRINCNAAQSPVLIDAELCSIIETCREGWDCTGGYFDIAFTAGGSSFRSIDFNESERTISFRDTNTRLDFGAFGKGYALDCAAELLRNYGVTQALLHGGTSSVLAIGNGDAECGWRVGLRSRWQTESELHQLHLSNKALSTSATGAASSDIIDPHSKSPINFQAACTVITHSAAQAEIFSTALLCMGRDAAKLFVKTNTGLAIETLWVDETSEPKPILL